MFYNKFEQIKHITLTVQYSTLEYSKVKCSTVQHSTVQHGTSVQVQYLQAHLHEYKNANNAAQNWSLIH